MSVAFGLPACGAALSTESAVEAMNRELAAVAPELVGNDDLLRGVLAGCGDCIKVLDVDGRLQFMSEGGKRVMEVEDFGKLKGCPWPDFWKGEGNQQAIAAVDAAKAGQTARFLGAADTAKGTFKYWDVQVSPIFGADGAVTQLLSISRDITEQWQAAERIRFLAEELEHRTKNSFAMVLAIAAQTFRGEENASQLQVFSARIGALATAHEAAQSDTPVRKVIDTALAPYQTGQSRFTITGPDIELSPRQALSLTLALNELATNATKYGALSVEEGSIDIRWSTSADAFVFAWREHGGPSVTEPSRVGFGTRVIKDLMANDFGGEVCLAYEPDGLVCELKVSLSNMQNLVR